MWGRMPSRGSGGGPLQSGRVFPRRTAGGPPLTGLQFGSRWFHAGVAGDEHRSRAKGDQSAPHAHRQNEERRPLRRGSTLALGLGGGAPTREWGRPVVYPCGPTLRCADMRLAATRHASCSAFRFGNAALPMRRWQEPTAA